MASAAAARVRMALGRGVRASVFVALVLGGLAWTFSFVLGNFSAKVLAGKWAPDSPPAVGLSVGGAVLALGLLLSVVAAARARKDPAAPLRRGGQPLEAVRWSRELHGLPSVELEADETVRAEWVSSD